MSGFTDRRDAYPTTFLKENNRRQLILHRVALAAEKPPEKQEAQLLAGQLIFNRSPKYLTALAAACVKEMERQELEAEAKG